MSAGSDEPEKEKVVLPTNLPDRVKLYREKKLTLAEQDVMERWWAKQREAWL